MKGRFEFDRTKKRVDNPPARSEDGGGPTPPSVTNGNQISWLFLGRRLADIRQLSRSVVADEEDRDQWKLEFKLARD